MPPLLRPSLIAFFAAVGLPAVAAGQTCPPSTQQTCVPGVVTGVSGPGTFATIQEAVCAQPVGASLTCRVQLQDNDPGNASLAYSENVVVDEKRNVRLEVLQRNDIPAGTLAATAPGAAVHWLSGPSASPGQTMIRVEGKSRLELAGGPGYDGTAATLGGVRRLMLGNRVGGLALLASVDEGSALQLDGVVLRAGAGRLIEVKGGALTAQRSVLLGGDVGVEPLIDITRKTGFADLLDMEIRADITLSSLAFSWPHEDTNDLGPAWVANNFAAVTAIPTALIRVMDGTLLLRKSGDRRGLADPLGPNYARRARGLVGGRRGVWAIKANATVTENHFIDVLGDGGANPGHGVFLEDSDAVVAGNHFFYDDLPGGYDQSSGIEIVDRRPGVTQTLLENNYFAEFFHGIHITSYTDDDITIQHNTLDECSEFGLRFSADAPIDVYSNAIVTAVGSTAGAFWDASPVGVGLMNFENNGFVGLGLPVLGYLAPAQAMTAYGPTTDIYGLAGVPGLTSDPAFWSPVDGLLPSSSFDDPAGSAPAPPATDINRDSRPWPAGTNEDQGAFEG